MEMTGARVLTVLCCWLLALSFFESSRSSLMLFGAGEQMRDLSLAPDSRDYTYILQTSAGGARWPMAQPIPVNRLKFFNFSF